MQIFPWSEEAQCMMSAFGRLVQERLREQRKQLISEDNVHHFSHGTAWQAHNSTQSDEISELHQHSHEMVISLADIRDGKLSIIETQISALAAAMQASFESLMFDTVVASSDRIGNVVENRGNLAQAFLDMFEKIEFGIDRSGKASLPTIALAPGNSHMLDPDKLALQMPDFRERLDAIIKAKSESAEQRERERRAKFKGSNP